MKRKIRRTMTAGRTKKENLARLDSLLLKAGGADCLAGFSSDHKVGKIVDHLQQIGTAADFGAFQADW